MKVSFVFTNYNNSKFTINLIDSLSKCDGIESSTVLIVDNNSSKDEIELLNPIEEQYDFVKVLYLDENQGYFKGLNTGIKYLLSLDIDFYSIVVGNNDLVFPNDFIINMSKRKEIFGVYPVISPDIVTLDGFHQNPHVIDKISFVRRLIWDIYYSNYTLSKIILNLANITNTFTDRNDEKQYKVAQLISQGYGACYILTNIFFDSFEELWSPTFLMGEEFFLSLQLEEKGYKVYYEPTIKVLHHDHATMKNLPSKNLWSFARESHRLSKMYKKKPKR